MAKTIFGAEKVITTVSTSKIDKVDEVLGRGIVDQGSYALFTIVSGSGKWTTITKSSNRLYRRQSLSSNSSWLSRHSA